MTRRTDGRPTLREDNFGVSLFILFAEIEQANSFDFRTDI